MEEQLAYILNILWGIIKNWWWVFLPFILWRPFTFFWLWWRREKWLFSQKKILLEIKMPKEVLKPLRAMEQVFSSIWGNLYDPPDWWETWFEGKLLQTVQLEMVSLEGKPHFYIRAVDARIPSLKASIYSQYPDAEISVVDDYTKYVPQAIPNKDWEMWGSDYVLIKEDVYPIKTYPKFFEERPEIAKEEKRVDPVATLLEGMGTFGPGEQLWVQIEAKPIANSKKWYERDFVSEGRKIADKLAKRPDKAKQKSILQEAAEELATGKMPGEEPVPQDLRLEAIYPPELRLTPGEKDVVAGVENKIAKHCFICYARFIYLAKRDVYFGAGKAVPFGFFQQFATENLNNFLPWGKTLTKVHRYPVLDLVRRRRLFIKKRRLFFRYVMRFEPLFPRPSGKGSFLLDTEELATLFHFPGRTVAPAPFVPRVEAKKGEAPPELPLEG
jgi:hypothetical protein